MDPVKSFAVNWNRLQGYHHYGQEVSNFRKNVDYQRFEFQNDGETDISIVLIQHGTFKKESFVIPANKTMMLGIIMDQPVQIGIQSVIGKNVSDSKSALGERKFLNQHLSQVVLKPSVVGWSIVFFKKPVMKA